LDIASIAAESETENQGSATPNVSCLREAALSKGIALEIVRGTPFNAKDIVALRGVFLEPFQVS
jgi:hypothetical protein